MNAKQIILYTVTVGIFIAVIDGAAFIQVVYIMKMPPDPAYFMIPTLVGVIFGTLLVLYRHYYVLAKERVYFEKIARTDALTGVMNRYSCELILDHESRRCQREQKPFSIILFDIDDFKRVNDTYGHLTGDRILVELCQCISKELRDMDRLCRWGGEEFIIILPETSGNGLLNLAERLRGSVLAYDFGLSEQLTVSQGAVSSTPQCHDTLKLIEKADKALYKAKNSGKNTVIYAK